MDGAAWNGLRIGIGGRLAASPPSSPSIRIVKRHCEGRKLAIERGKTTVSNGAQVHAQPDPLAGVRQDPDPSADDAKDALSVFQRVKVRRGLSARGSHRSF